MAAVHRERAIRVAERLWLVRDNEDSRSRAGSLTQQTQDPSRTLSIQAGGRLVSQHHSRAHEESTSDTDAAQLTA